MIINIQGEDLINMLIELSNYGRFDKPQYKENIVNEKTEKYYIICNNQNKRFVIECYDSNKTKVGLLTSFNIEEYPEEKREYLMQKLRSNGWTQFGRSKTRLKYDTNGKTEKQIRDQMKIFQF